MMKFFKMVVLVALVASPAMAGTIVGSKHDMIASGFATANGGAGTEVCIFCHTPHNAQPEPLVPLWNNTADANATGFYTSPTTTWQLADSAPINATDARICLACHDGSVSGPMNGPNGGGSIDITGAVMSANAILGYEMSNDHPIGMDIGANPNGLDSGIRTIAAIKGNFGGVTPFFGSTDDSVNIMYCSSCHDVHDGDPLMKPFLRKSNVGSALCKACHIK